MTICFDDYGQDLPLCFDDYGQDLPAPKAEAFCCLLNIQLTLISCARPK